MPASAAEDLPRVRSWITTKAVKGGASGIEGMGVPAIDAIADGEVVAVKGGHIVHRDPGAIPEAIPRIDGGRKPEQPAGLPVAQQKGNRA
jgi:hypothetical protein